MHVKPFQVQFFPVREPKPSTQHQPTNNNTREEDARPTTTMGAANKKHARTVRRHPPTVAVTATPANNQSAFASIGPITMWGALLALAAALILSTVVVVVPDSTNIILDASSELSSSNTGPSSSKTFGDNNTAKTVSAVESVDPFLAYDEQQHQRKKVLGALRPKDLPGRSVFRQFHTTNATLSFPSDSSDGGDGGTEPEFLHLPYLMGSVRQINRFEASIDAEVAVLPSLVPHETVQQMLQLLRDYGDDNLDDDPDTVDAMPTYEIFVDSVDLRNNSPTLKVRDNHNSGNNDIEHYRRKHLRAQLQELTSPYVHRLTQAVRLLYPQECGGIIDTDTESASGAVSDRACTACYSLIRRYRSSDRLSHAPHYDGHAIATTVVSLSEYGTDYTGGLYVATGHGMREFLNLSIGDAALHKSTLLHGVHVYPPNEGRTAEDDHPSDESKSRKPTAERWSWIVWFRDSTTCKDHSVEWFAHCAKEGNPLCQQLHATKIIHEQQQSPAGTTTAEQPLPLSLEERSRRVLQLNVQAARGGAAEAAVKVARAYLKLLPSELQFDVDQAKRYFQMAIESHSPEGHYGMAQILVAEAATEEANGSPPRTDLLRRAVEHLESAAKQHHAFAAFNLGMAHVFGYGIPVNLEVGVEWFQASGLPEGYFLAAQYAATIGDEARYEQWIDRARVLGMDRPWRQEARHRTGSGGAAGVDLNLMWPPSEARDRMQPPKF